MAEGETKAGSWLGDLSNEWRKAKTPERVLIVGAIAATVGIALYLHKQSTGPNQPGAPGNQYGIPANFQQGTSGGGTGGTTGSVGTTNPPTQNKPPSPPTAPNKPVSKPVPTPIFKATPIIRQPTQVTKVAASVNHAPSVSRPPQYPHRPGGNYGITPIVPPAEPARGNTMSQTQKRLININR